MTLIDKINEKVIIALNDSPHILEEIQYICWLLNISVLIYLLTKGGLYC